MEWFTIDYVTPPLDKNVLCLLDTGDFAVCFYYDGRFAYANNEHWGFGVKAWRHLDNINDINKQLERGY